jgi:cell division protein FtsB
MKFSRQDCIVCGGIGIFGIEESSEDITCPVCILRRENEELKKEIEKLKDKIKDLGYELMDMREQL